MPVAIEIAGLILAAAVGAVCGYVLAERRRQVAQTQLQTAAALAEQRQADLQQQLAAEKNQTQLLREAHAQAERNLATAQAQFDAAQRNIAEQRQLIEHAQGQLRQAFASASAEVLARNNETFLQLAKERFATLSAQAVGSLDQRKEQIDALLKPLRQLIEQYQVRTGDIEKSRVESYSMLREQLGTLAESQRTLNQQTSQLVTALSRPSVRGQWGEISLRRLVELAGLSKQCDFVEQQSVSGEQGRLRPDMIVHLPGGRDVVIDCKTPLEAFLDAAAAVDEDTRKVLLQRHAQQVRSRGRELAAKNYPSQFSRAPEYVIMFLPGEAFLYAAVEQDPSLIEDCLQNRVIVATPTTLIALLKAIEFGWRQEALAENAEQIKALGTDLYDRIGTLLSHIAKLGSSLTAAVTSYNSTLACLETRVMVSARKMGELGARTNKELPAAPPVEVAAREVTVGP